LRSKGGKPMSAIPAIKHAKLIRAFNNAGAVGKGNAKSLDEIGIKMNQVLKVHLYRKMVIADGDKYYLVEKYSKRPIEKLMDFIKGN